jgi:hypothetical protein
MAANTTDLPLFTADVTQEVRIRQLSSDGPAALPAITVLQQFDRTVKKYENEPALHQKVPIPVRFQLLSFVRLGSVHLTYYRTFPIIF